MTEPEQPTSEYGTYGSGDAEFGAPAGDSGPDRIPPGAPPFSAPTGPAPQPPYGGGQQWQYGAGGPGGYQQPYYYGYGYAPQRPGTNGMAIAAMVCGLCGFLCLIPGIVGLILGLISLPEIKRSGQSGRGMAITGIVAGALWVVGFVLLIVFAHHGAAVDPGTGGGAPA